VAALKAGWHTFPPAHVDKVLYWFNLQVEAIFLEVLRVALAALARLGLVERALKGLGKSRPGPATQGKRDNDLAETVHGTLLYASVVLFSS
jgi:hypothetical protein